MEDATGEMHMGEGTSTAGVALGRLRISVGMSPTDLVMEHPTPSCNCSSTTRSWEDAHTLLCVFSTTSSMASAMVVFPALANLKLRRSGNWEVHAVLIVTFFRIKAAGTENLQTHTLCGYQNIQKAHPSG